MSPEQRDDGGHEADDRPGNTYRQRRQILKADATFIEVAGGAWSAALYVLASFWIEYRPLASGLMFASAGIASAFVVYIHFRHLKRNKRRIVWHVVSAFATLHVALLVLAGLSYAGWIFGPKPPGADLVLDRAASFYVSPMHDGMAKYAIGKAILPDKLMLTPVDFLLFVQLRDTGSRKHVISEYRMSAVVDGVRRKLCRVDVMPDNELFFLSSYENLAELAVTPPFVNLRNSVIQSNETTEFWIAWMCPTKCDLKKLSGIQMQIAERDGRSNTVDFPTSKSAPGAEFDTNPGLGMVGVVHIKPPQLSVLERGACHDGQPVSVN